MKDLKIDFNNSQKKIKVPTGVKMLVRRCCVAVLESEHIDGAVEVSVSFVDNDQIHSLNRQYRNIDAPTDVLSFPLYESTQEVMDSSDGVKLLGDIVISMEKAQVQAETYGHSLNREIGFLTVHSMLHLLGYDHETSGLDAVRMREKEEKVLGAIGLSRTDSYSINE